MPPFLFVILCLLQRDLVVSAAPNPDLKELPDQAKILQDAAEFQKLDANFFQPTVPPTFKPRHEHVGTRHRHRPTTPKAPLVEEVPPPIQVPSTKAPVKRIIIKTRPKTTEATTAPPVTSETTETPTGSETTTEPPKKVKTIKRIIVKKKTAPETPQALEQSAIAAINDKPPDNPEILSNDTVLPVGKKRRVVIRKITTTVPTAAPKKIRIVKKKVTTTPAPEVTTAAGGSEISPEGGTPDSVTTAAPKKRKVIIKVKATTTPTPAMRKATKPKMPGNDLLQKPVGIDEIESGDAFKSASGTDDGMSMDRTPKPPSQFKMPTLPPPKKPVGKHRHMTMSTVPPPLLGRVGPKHEAAPVHHGDMEKWKKILVVPTTTTTTEAPVVTTETEVVTTEANVGTEAPAVGVATEASATLNEAAAVETEAPAAPTEPSATETEPPLIPTETPAVPAEASDAPTEAPATPAEAPDVPAEAPAAPAEVPDAPVEAPAAPAEAPDVPTETPAAPAEAPDVPTDSPAVPAEAPEVPTETPPVPTEAPAAPIESPDIQTEAPAVPAETADVPSEAPVLPAEEPVVPAEEPVVPAEEPVGQAEAPVVPAEAPDVATEDASVPTEEAPAISTEAPTEAPTEPPTVPTEAPTTTTPIPPPTPFISIQQMSWLAPLPFLTATIPSFVSTTVAPFISTTVAPFISTTVAPIVSTTVAPEEVEYVTEYEEEEPPIPDSQEASPTDGSWVSPNNNPNQEANKNSRSLFRGGPSHLDPSSHHDPHTTKKPKPKIKDDFDWMNDLFNGMSPFGWDDEDDEPPPKTTHVFKNTKKLAKEQEDVTKAFMHTTKAAIRNTEHLMGPNTTLATSEELAGDESTPKTDPPPPTEMPTIPPTEATTTPPVITTTQAPPTKAPSVSKVQQEPEQPPPDHEEPPHPEEHEAAPLEYVDHDEPPPEDVEPPPEKIVPSEVQDEAPAENIVPSEVQDEAPQENNEPPPPAEVPEAPVEEPTEKPEVPEESQPASGPSETEPETDDAQGQIETTEAPKTEPATAKPFDDLLDSEIVKFHPAPEDGVSGLAPAASQDVVPSWVPAPEDGVLFGVAPDHEPLATEAPELETAPTEDLPADESETSDVTNGNKLQSHSSGTQLINKDGAPVGEITSQGYTVESSKEQDELPNELSDSLLSKEGTDKLKSNLFTMPMLKNSRSMISPQESVFSMQDSTKVLLKKVKSLTGRAEEVMESTEDISGLINSREPEKPKKPVVHITTTHPPHPHQSHSSGDSSNRLSSWNRAFDLWPEESASTEPSVVESTDNPTDALGTTTEVLPETTEPPEITEAPEETTMAAEGVEIFEEEPGENFVDTEHSTDDTTAKTEHPGTTHHTPSRATEVTGKRANLTHAQPNPVKNFDKTQLILNDLFGKSPEPHRTTSRPHHIVKTAHPVKVIPATHKAVATPKPAVTPRPIGPKMTPAPPRTGQKSKSQSQPHVPAYPGQSSQPLSSFMNEPGDNKEEGEANDLWGVEGERGKKAYSEKKRKSKPLQRQGQLPPKSSRSLAGLGGGSTGVRSVKASNMAFMQKYETLEAKLKALEATFQELEEQKKGSGTKPSGTKPSGKELMTWAQKNLGSIRKKGVLGF